MAKVYLIIEINVFNKENYLKYVEQVPAIIQKYGGRYIARGGEVVSMIGSKKPERVIIIEFDNKDQIQKCFSSPEYLKIAPFREKSTQSNAIIVDGI